MKTIVRLLLALSVTVMTFSGCQTGAEQPLVSSGQTVTQPNQRAGSVTAITPQDSPKVTSSPLGSTQEPLQADKTSETVATGYGAAGGLADTDLTLQEMLTYSLQDEYLARTEYAAILDKFGSQRPFSNIIKAEETHITTLLPLFEAYGFTAPEDESAALMAVPSSIAASLQAGVEAEIHNIDMYDRFLKESLPEDVKTVFLELRNASQNHLNAFQRGLNR